MKQIDVEIMGQHYLLTCPADGEVPLMKAVERVDLAMCKIRDAGKVKARDRIAVLASLNLAFELSEALERAPVAVPTLPTTAPVPGTGEQGDVAQLLQRLDQALMSDSRLI